jgi:upstream activation factor subunit UAF30
MQTTAPQKKTRSKASGNGSPGALQKPLQPSEELAVVVGSAPLSQGDVVRKVWDYIKLHNLQNPENLRKILADNSLKRVFGR